MKLSKALKVKKNLIGEIAKLKSQIARKNSYLIGSKNGKNFPAQRTINKLMEKINLLTDLKYNINQANREIQVHIYMLAEYKALIAFYQLLNVNEGVTEAGGFRNAGTTLEYAVHISEEQRDDFVNYFQLKVDALQDEIDNYNFTTEIPWGEEAPKTDAEILKETEEKKEA